MTKTDYFENIDNSNVTFGSHVTKSNSYRTKFVILSIYIFSKYFRGTVYKNILFEKAI